MEMLKFFWCGFVLDDFIFKGLSITSLAGFFAIIAVSCLAAFLLALVTFVIEMMNLVKNSPCEITNAQTEDCHNNSEAWQSWTKTSSTKIHLLQTLLSLIQIILGYILMLIVMSFNVYLLISVIMGSLLGYFILNPILSAQHQFCSLKLLSSNKINIQEEDALLLKTGNTDPLVTSSGACHNSTNYKNVISVSASVHT